MAEYRTSFDCQEGRLTRPNDTQYFMPFIEFVPEEGTEDYDGVEILLTFAEGTPFSIVEKIGGLLNQHVKAVQVTR